jgi:D-3-phosphoglycerate dehydrogenase
LKVIATATTGLNHIDVPYAKERGIEILSLKDEVSFLDTVTSTAELAFGLLIALMRQIPASFDSVREGRLDLEGFRGSSLYGKTLGIVGMGRLGKIIAEGAAGWRMRVIFHDPAVAQERFPHFRKVSLDELLRESDAISLHLHLSEKTEKMFGRDAFEKMKDTAFLVNTSRGEIVEEEALLSVLEKKEIGGYATDVLTNELELVKKGLAGHPLVEYAKKSRNCIIVPHTGGFTDDSRIATDVFIAKKLIQYLESHG